MEKSHKHGHVPDSNPEHVNLRRNPLKPVLSNRHVFPYRALVSCNKLNQCRYEYIVKDSRTWNSIRSFSPPPLSLSVIIQ